MLLLPLFCDIVTVSSTSLESLVPARIRATHKNRKARFQSVYEDENSAYAKTIREELHPKWMLSSLAQIAQRPHWQCTLRHWMTGEQEHLEQVRVGASELHQELISW